MVGKEILGYHVDEKIGSGGFGTVYRVSKTNAAGTYIRALKHITLPTKKQYASVLNSMGGDYAKADDYFASALKDIVNEIKILSTLSESGVTNIVRYYENDIIETDSPKTYDIYILMEFLTPFTDYIENNSFTVRNVIGLGKDILRALISCHEKNIIHRDIKDDNIFVSPDGAYKLGDFGVSKALKDKSRAESVKGTPNFIAPEVYLGKEKYDHTVDLYSLGIVLYKLLNHSRNPFLPAFPAPYSTDDEDAAFEARMTGRVPDLPGCAQNELGRIVQKAISPRIDRFNSAVEFLNALETAEKQMSAEELDFVVCEALLPNNTKNISGSFAETKKRAADETIALNVSMNDDEEARAEDRHLFDTFAAPPTIAREDTPRATVEEKKEKSPFAPPVTPTHPGDQVSDWERRQRRSNDSSPEPEEKKVDKKRITLFILPPVFLALYIAFFLVFIPLIYGKFVSFVKFIVADVENIVALVQDTGSIFSPAYVVLLLVVVQYLILAALCVSLFLLCKELHNGHKKKPEPVTVKYTDKMPQLMLNDALLTLKSNTLYTDKNAVQTLSTVVDSLKYSKGFGYSKQANVIVLENEICDIIDALVSEVASDSTQTLANVSSDIMKLKQKNMLRDSMLKK